MEKTVRVFIPFAVAITLLCGLVYITAQQMYRQNANDPQIAYAEDIASSLNNGATPQQIIPPTKIDMGKSLATFIMVFDNKNELILSTGEINGKVLSLPSGVFAYVNKNGEDRITWQPQSNVRVAAVVTKYNDGYVLAGRSLKEVENRVSALTLKVVAAWVAALLATFIAIFLFFPKARSK